MKFDSLSLAAEVVAASTALAGLILVYLGSLHHSFIHLHRDERAKARRDFRLRTNFALAGSVISLAAAILAIVGKWVQVEYYAHAAVACLMIAFVAGVIIAFLTAWDVT